MYIRGVRRRRLVRLQVARASASEMYVRWRGGTLSVDVEMVPLSELLAAISRITGIQTEGGEELNERISVHLAGFKPLELLLQLLAEFDYAISAGGGPQGEGGRVVILRRGTAGKPSALEARTEPGQAEPAAAAPPQPPVPANFTVVAEHPQSLQTPGFQTFPPHEGTAPLQSSSGDTAGTSQPKSSQSVQLNTFWTDSQNGASHARVQYHGGPILANFTIYPLYYGNWPNRRTFIFSKLTCKAGSLPLERDAPHDRQPVISSMVWYPQP